MTKRLAICLLLLIGGALTAQPVQTPQAMEVDLLGLSAQRVGDALPANWQVRAVRGQQVPASMIVDSGDGRFLRFSGRGRAAFFVRRLEMPLRSGGRLEWSWRARLAPVGASLSSRATDDAALRVFVVFAKRGRFETTPRALFYTLADGMPPEPAAGARRPPLASLAAGTPALTRDWVRVETDPFVDYRRLWQADATEIVAIGVMQDTDQTGTSAVGDLMNLLWRK